jgi:uncharacterized protein YjaZ
MISEKEYKEAKRVVDNYNKQQLNIPLTMISLSDLREKYNKCYDEMIRCKKGKMMVWYYAEKKKLTELRNELDKRKTN